MRSRARQVDVYADITWRGQVDTPVVVTVTVQPGCNGNRNGHPDTWEPDEPAHIEDVLEIRHDNDDMPREARRIYSIEGEWVGKGEERRHVSDVGLYEEIIKPLLDDQSFVDKACEQAWE